MRQPASPQEVGGKDGQKRARVVVWGRGGERRAGVDVVNGREHAPREPHFPLMLVVPRRSVLLALLEER